MIPSGRTPLIACLSTYFVVPSRKFISDGIVASESRARIEVTLSARQRHVAHEISSSHPIGHRAADLSQYTPRKRRQGCVAPLPLLHQVLVVSRKEFIPAVPRQHDFHTLGCQP